MVFLHCGTMGAVDLNNAVKYPGILKLLTRFEYCPQGCKAVGSLLSVPPLAILCGVQGVLSFALAHAEVQVPDTMWREPGLLRLAIGMPVGMLLLNVNI